MTALLDCSRNFPTLQGDPAASGPRAKDKFGSVTENFAPSLLAAAGAVIIIGVGLSLFGCSRTSNPKTSEGSNSTTNAGPAGATVELSSDQLRAIKIQPVGTHLFSIEKRGIGSIDFNNKLYFDNNLSVQVFPPHEGKIVKILVELGDEVQKGESLYIIGAAGKPDLEVRSPITGQITSVNATAGLSVQPGKAPAPCAVADVMTKWMVGNVLESESPLFHLGQPVEVKVMAYPGRVFEGKLSKIYPTVDANTHRTTIRCDVADPENELRSGMLAEFVARVQNVEESVAVPANSVVREGDGTMTAWVTSDRHRFSQRVIKTGIRRDDWVQVLEGVERGELVVTDGAIFLSNMLQAPPSD